MFNHPANNSLLSGAVAIQAKKIIELTNVDFSLRHFLLPLMRAARDRGHEVIGVAAEGPLLDDARAEGFRIIALPFRRSFSPWAQIRAFVALVRLFRAEKPDLVHAHMPITGFLGRIAARVAGVPVIAYTCHGFLFNQDGGLSRRAVSFAMEWIAGRVTDFFFTVSTVEAFDARRLHIFGSPVAIGNGRDPKIFRPDPAARTRIRAEIEGVPGCEAPNRVIVVTVARLVRDKGFLELADAMRQVPEAELWVVGERLASDRGEDMAAMLRQAGLGDRLRLLGYRRDVAAILAAADIFVLPSYFEALPMSVIEAMLSGLPVVASDIPGPRQQIVPGETGLLVTVRDANALAAGLRRLAEDAALRAAMGKAGRRRAEELFDEAQVAARTLDLLGL